MLIEGLYTTETFDKNEEGISAQIKLNPKHEIFKGHFPGKPIMPGVCMIQIIKELTERSLGQDLFLSVASNVKFMAIINPETDPILLIDINLSEMDGLFKVKSTTIFGETVALKLNATFKSAA
ncbi:MULTISPECIES: 3-hydroxyacyl-ACP dehydratase [Arenibacter]|jgi:3-hydroxyacyl-[acyl-carrier-protein] dehydratase|uniref:(3R)-hydroxymyristoyl-ACP dehydratase n=1 Tax=Arenibacter algicola TaxID=616991 RepID=A0A221UXU2_9FLAO|nr:MULTISPECIES: 3-hydroxyacyl-ACP dehydratase [Arenibacter]ASO06155.1 (3R)-hydroxymyristoyl-ACP dehydratase [Arenibacter algicola]MDX1759245.1 3-hydroxyacyl-ACP dehydratase [Arenibacter algicola]GBF19574.1 (3R)-hydroxymyristoyl-ACP dehydratase [Arenibacter sp. NBRC 103722]HCO82247.1 3-hydroxyacyl-ACP dehydratase [Arenibacter sp.]|tara:strand:- start:1222 stop:1590 length:369 start_codon:yes stop_codon:yes gene_type:complete